MHQFDRGGAVAPADGLEQQAMLLEGLGCAAGVLVEKGDERSARDELGEDFREHDIAGCPGDDLVEIAQQVVARLRRPGLDRLVFEHDVVVEGVDVLGGGHLDEPGDDRGLDDSARLEHLARLAHRRLGHERAAARDQRNQFVARQLEQRLAEWGADDDDGSNDGGDGEDAGTRKGLPEKKRKKLADPATWARDFRLVDTALQLREALGEAVFEDHNVFRERVDGALQQAGLRVPAAELKLILKAVSWRVESAPPVIAKVHKAAKTPGKVGADPLHGLYATTLNGKPAVVEYEADPELRDTEQVPLLEEGGIEAFIRREVLPYTADAWVKADATKVGYEISFTRHFYKMALLNFVWVTGHEG